MGLRFIFVLLCLLAGAVNAAPATPSSPHKAYLSLIIDDLGQNLPRDRRVLALPARSPPRSCLTPPRRRIRP